jgi:hypothetical protein
MLRQRRKELATLALKPGKAKALMLHMRIFEKQTLKFTTIAFFFQQQINFK